MSTSSAFPYPIPEYGTETYWQSCNEGLLVMQKCDSCHKFRWIPSPLCTHCSAAEFTWAPLSGRGRVTTWIVITHPVHPAAVSRVPYVVAEIELVEQAGLRMVSNLIAVDSDDIEFDAPVALDFVKHPSGQQLPVFRLETG